MDRSQWTSSFSCLITSHSPCAPISPAMKLAVRPSRGSILRASARASAPTTPGPVKPCKQPPNGAAIHNHNVDPLNSTLRRVNIRTLYGFGCAVPGGPGERSERTGGVESLTASPHLHLFSYVWLPQCQRIRSMTTKYGQRPSDPFRPDHPSPWLHVSHGMTMQPTCISMQVHMLWGNQHNITSHDMHRHGWSAASSPA